MQLGMIGLGRMGANMVRRLLRAGHAGVAYDPVPGAVAAVVAEGAAGAASLEELAAKLAPPRAVCMVAVEYGLMAAYAEGLAILRAADAGSRPRAPDAETAPLRDPERYRYDLDVGEIAELWRRGSVVGSWLLDLLAGALAEGASLDAHPTRVSDSGEGRWALQAAIDEGVPAPVLAAALHQRLSSQGEGDYANRVLSAMRAAFGGHGVGR